MKNEYEVYLAKSVLEAKAAIEKYEPQILILDYVLSAGTAADVLDYVNSEKIKCKSIVLTKTA